MKSEDIDNMYHADLELLWNGLQNGLYGPVADAQYRYTIITILLVQLEQMKVSSSNGKYSPTKARTFAESFPMHSAMQNMDREVQTKKQKFNDQALAAFGKPKWMREKEDAA